LILWNLRDTVDETASKSDQKIAHKMIGSRIGRSGQACRIQLCSMKKNVKLLNLAYALQAPSSPQTEEAAKQAEPQPEKKPSEKAKVQPKKRPSAKARARATKKPSSYLLTLASCPHALASCLHALASCLHALASHFIARVSSARL
jgi:cell division septation protein DedD